MAMVGRASGPSLSFTVVATGLGRVRVGGGVHCANHSYQCIAANGPVLVDENKPLNKCVYIRTCLFICLKHRGDFNTILHAQLEFSFHDIFNNAFCQGFAAGQLINLGIHLAMGDPFVLQVPGLVIVHVMGFGNPV